MILFSTIVAVVIGKFKAVPKQAHWIDFLLINERTTPKVVAPRITNVINNDRYSSVLIRKANPNTLSIKG